MRLLPRSDPAAGRSSTRPVARRIPGRTPAWQRRYRRHRRVLAALLAGVVVWGVVGAVRPAPAATAAVLVARHDLVPGAVLRADDVALEQRPLVAVPPDAAASENVVGRTIAFPVRLGEAVTPRHVVGAELLAALGAGLVATPVTLADPASGVLVSRGDVVDVLAARSGAAGTGEATASVVASRVRVLVAPVPSTASTGGLLGGSSPDSRGSSALVLATTTEQALAIAGAAVGSRLSLTIRSG